MIVHPPMRFTSLLFLTVFIIHTLLDIQLVIGQAQENEEHHYSYTPDQFLQSHQQFRQDLGAPKQIDQDCPSSSTPPSKTLIVAAVQMKTIPSSSNNDAKDFFHRATTAIETAVQKHNATLILLQELFLGPYFCQSQEASLFGLAEDLSNIDFQNHTNPILTHFQSLAKQHNVILPISLFERSNNAYYNTIIVIDSDGSILGNYRKSHIPDGTGYQEKFYFSPGDTGFPVFPTREGFVIGVGICWDQWFPEAARIMALKGADVLLYPTAIGTEPQDPTLDSSKHWQRVMQGHAAANMVPVVASNRIGTEILLDRNTHLEKQRIHFYGKSFITDETGDIIQEANSNVDVDIIASTINVQENRAIRSAWGLFRDRRPELYGVLKTKDGRNEIHLK